MNKKSSDGRSTVILIWLRNLAELKLVFGSQFQTYALAEVCKRIADCGICREDCEVLGEVIQVLLRTEGESRYVRLVDDLLQCMCDAIEALPINFQDIQAYLRVQAGVVHMDSHDQTRHTVDTACIQPTRPMFRSTTWGTGFLGDMKMAVCLLNDLRERRLRLAFQPIYVLENDGPEQVLYEEVLLRREGECGTAPIAAIEALERLGLITRLDKSVIWTVVDLLARYPRQRLAVNVSTYSLCEGKWWGQLLSFLQEHPQIACRMTIEVTETASTLQYDKVLALIAGLQKRGVHVALDDFGAGHSTVTLLTQARFDIVKLDRSMLLQSEAGRFSHNLLQNMVRFCTDYCDCIVVEGVETTQQLKAARNAGGHAVQGFFVQRPTYRPVWLIEDDVVVNDYLDRQTQDLICQSSRQLSPFAHQFTRGSQQ